MNNTQYQIAFGIVFLKAFILLIIVISSKIYGRNTKTNKNN